MNNPTTVPTRSKENFLIFGSPAIEEAEINEVIATLRSGWIGCGPRVARFEEQFREYKGWGHAAAVNSCTAALHLSLLASGVGPGDQVITTPLTFCATVNAIIHTGATPVLADVNPLTMNIDPAAIRRKITRKTKAIVPVHFAGRACEMESIVAISRRHGLRIIEDCAHAIETEIDGKKAGTFGDFGCFSFYVTKNVTCGEGGMILCRKTSDAARVKIMALHGLSKDAWRRFGDEGYKHYAVTAAGFKYTMMDIQAALATHQLGRVEENWRKRQNLWRAYGDGLADLRIGLPAEPEAGTRHAFHLYTILIDPARSGITREQFLQAMHRRNIGVGVHYLSLPEHPFYQKKFDWRPRDYPNAMKIGRQTVSLPLSPKLTAADAADVIAAVRSIVTANVAKKAA